MEIVLTLVTLLTISNMIWLYFLSKSVVNIVNNAEQILERPISDSELRKALKQKWGTRQFPELEQEQSDGTQNITQVVDPLSQWAVIDEE